MKAQWLGRVAGTLMVSALSVAGAAAQDRHDTRIANDVSRQIQNYTQLTIFDYVDGTVENGIVTLRGKVTMPFKKTDIVRRAGAVGGVNEVLDQIEVLPASIYDEDLRRRIARAIYGHSAFWQYGARANPPIHIIVERGHVTLAGVVLSNVDRMLARSLAVGFGELSVTNELRTDNEMRSE